MSFNENTCTVTGVVRSVMKDFEHNKDLCTLKISSRSQCRSFYDKAKKTRPELFDVETHAGAADKASLLKVGDPIVVRGQLTTRVVTEDPGSPVRVVIVVQDAESIGRISR